jgi:hypothetical protein
MFTDTLSKPLFLEPFTRELLYAFVLGILNVGIVHTLPFGFVVLGHKINYVRF